MAMARLTMLDLTLETKFTLRSRLQADCRGMGMKILLVVLLAAIAFGCRTNESPKGQANDLQITAQVKSKLASEVGFSTLPNISVNSTNAVVTLAGQVSSAEAKARAGAITQSIPKVVKVVNNLQLAPES